MGIPVFLSQVVAAATDTVKVGAGTVQNLSVARYYFYMSPMSTAANGQSLLIALKALAEASTGGITWTFAIDANLKLKVTHNNIASQNLVLGRGLAWNLGFAKVALTSYPPDVTLTETIPVPAGAGGYTAEYRSPWIWCPEMRVSDTGPGFFDPMTSPGIRTSAGSSSRAPDMTPSHTKNGEQIEATFIFTAVEGMYRAREPDLNAADTHEREAYETWWRLGPSEGRRFLFCRDKALLISVAIFGSTSPSIAAPTYVEYAPSAALRAAPDVRQFDQADLYWWNISVPCWLTENGYGSHLG